MTDSFSTLPSNAVRPSYILVDQAQDDRLFMRSEPDNASISTKNALELIAKVDTDRAERGFALRRGDE